MKFRNKFDRTTIIITSLVFALLSGITIFVLTDDIQIYAKAAIALMNVSILFLTWALHPQHYMVYENSIQIKRFFKPIEIQFDKIIEIKSLEKNELSGSIRLFGSGGLFGYFGRFSNKKLGTYFLYAGNLENLLLIKTDKKVYVISPLNSNEFIERLKTMTMNTGEH